MFADPSNDTPAIVLAVSNVVAVLALPVNAPTTSTVIDEGSPIVIVCAEVVVVTSLEVPKTLNVCVSKSIVVEVVPSLTVRLSSTDIEST